VLRSGFASSYDQYRDIRFDAEKSLWRGRGNFQVQFIHPGLYYAHPVKVNIIDSSGVRAAAYSPQLFRFDTNKFGDRNCRRSRLCGFRRSIPDFRAAKNFRRSKNFWLQRPRPDAHEMTLMGARVRHTKSDRECSRFPVASYRRCGERTEGRNRACRLSRILLSASLTNTLACMETPSGRLAQNARSCTKSAQIAGPKSHRALAQRLLSDR
jgi:hypothetical protein